MEIKKIDDVVVLRPEENELINASEICGILNEQFYEGERKIAMDVSKFEIIQSIQVGTIVTCHLLCYENLAVFKLMGVNEKVKNVLRLVGLDKMMALNHGTDVAELSFGELIDQDTGKPRLDPNAKN